MCKIIISAFLAVLGMPIDMYGERRRRDLQARRPNVQYMAGLGGAHVMISKWVGDALISDGMYPSRFSLKEYDGV